MAGGYERVWEGKRWDEKERGRGDEMR